MRIGQRTVRQWRGYQRIVCGDHTLVVEERDYYTSYLLFHGFDYSWKVPILRHEVRSPEPLPIRPAQIIYARHIPWYLWLYYSVRDAIRWQRFKRENRRHQKAEAARIQKIRALAEKHMGEGRFGGRYNR